MVTLTREEKIENNIGLVHSIAARFKGRGVDYEDLFQNGCVGLIKAVDNFDESKGFAFSTYAVPVIMGEIKRYIRDDGMIKVSRSLKEIAHRCFHSIHSVKTVKAQLIFRLTRVTCYLTEFLYLSFSLIYHLMSSCLLIVDTIRVVLRR